jgi:hypothetical protein
MKRLMWNQILYLRRKYDGVVRQVIWFEELREELVQSAGHQECWQGTVCPNTKINHPWSCQVLKALFCKPHAILGLENYH